ncbi:hypothetical protein LCGC14_0536990 [marine sediment metagenome]|uniref:Uncharacterized protein n=1 Tax=marine sediment metagenome TaxID=412755 RepID=A0A0F9RYN3_9ZZZZ
MNTETRKELIDYMSNEFELILSDEGAKDIEDIVAKDYRSVLNNIKRLYVIEGDSKSMIKEVAKILSGATDLLIK